MTRYSINNFTLIIVFLVTSLVNLIYYLIFYVFSSQYILSFSFSSLLAYRECFDRAVLTCTVHNLSFTNREMRKLVIRFSSFSRSSFLSRICHVLL